MVWLAVRQFHEYRNFRKQHNQIIYEELETTNSTIWMHSAMIQLNVHITPNGAHDNEGCPGLQLQVISCWVIPRLIIMNTNVWSNPLSFRQNHNSGWSAFSCIWLALLHLWAIAEQIWLPRSTERWPKFDKGAILLWLPWTAMGLLQWKCFPPPSLSVPGLLNLLVNSKLSRTGGIFMIPGGNKVILWFSCVFFKNPNPG